MGRRPGVKQGSGLNLGALDPETKEAINKIAKAFFDEALARLRDKIEHGALKQLSTKELLSEINKMMKSIQGPSTSLTAIQLPMAPQAGAIESQPRPNSIETSAEDPAKVAKLRERQQKFLENPNGTA